MSDGTGAGAKFCSCCCLAMILAITISMFCVYNQLWSTAKAYDEAALDGLTYDQCGIDTTG